MDLTQAELVKRFTIWDYLVFVAMLLISSLIGFYYACTGGKQKTTREFLMADRNMGVFPVSLSLLASSVSAITLLGIPTEMYNFNASFSLVGIGYCIMIPATAYFYLPVFYRLRLMSAFEYLERRFNKTIRRLGSLMFIIQMTIYLAVVLYAPALALSQVTGLHLWASVVTIGIVCTFYTTMGGMKAVMWTNAFQAIMMFGAIVAVIIKGCIDLGGIDIVWQRALDGKRLDIFDFTPDPLVRHSFWSITIGGTFTWLSVYGVSQAQVQRYLTTPSIKIAQRALWWNLVGLIVLLIVCCLTGLVLYARYWDCDPLTTNQIKFSDQLLPLFVMDTMGLYPGVPGFFVAGIFSGALSTISSGMNSLAAVTLEDFLKTWCFPHMSDSRATLISKILAFFYGILCIALVAIAERLGDILQTALTIFGVIGGPILGVFSLGIFIPCANSIGAGIGLITSLVITLWIACGAQIYNVAQFQAKAPVSTSGCIFNYTLDLMNSTGESALMDSLHEPIVESEVLGLYRISYMWYSFVGCSIVVIVGTIVSAISGPKHPDDLDPYLICPIFDKCCCCLPEKLRKYLRYGTKKISSPPQDIELNGLKHKLLS